MQLARYRCESMACTYFPLRFSPGDAITPKTPAETRHILGKGDWPKQRSTRLNSSGAVSCSAGPNSSGMTISLTAKRHPATLYHIVGQSVVYPPSCCMKNERGGGLSRNVETTMRNKTWHEPSRIMEEPCERNMRGQRSECTPFRPADCLPRHQRRITDETASERLQQRLDATAKPRGSGVPNSRCLLCMWYGWQWKGDQATAISSSPRS